MFTDTYKGVPKKLLIQMHDAPDKATFLALREKVLRKMGAEKARRLRRALEAEKQKGGLDYFDLVLLGILIGKPHTQMYDGYSPLTIQDQIRRGILPMGWTPPRPPAEQPPTLLADYDDGPRYSASQDMERKATTKTPPEKRPLNVAKLCVAYLSKRMDGGDGSPHARLEGVMERLGSDLLAFLNSLSYGEASSLVARDLLSIRRDLPRYRRDGVTLAEEDDELVGDWQHHALPKPPPEDTPEDDGGGTAPPPPGGR